ncbi:LOW QUALITY PROTEIN: hypothetical protein Cgig2_015681 [Carnegiea gigantea]|uniref:Uncharacterized protein n=1 Tax=Carnegiea gigantea TaxID=171969 RepID=A0A9Q1Q6V0_9CARY|nr:LOW QUALITY PROTEIN: hypothetical protein Cgig2_015681 [Carnegiea gigantea]
MLSTVGKSTPQSSGYFGRIWEAYDIDKIILVKKGSSKQAGSGKEGVYFFNTKPRVLKRSNREMDLRTEAIKSLPIWLPDLDIKHWGTESLSKIGSMLGIPLKTNQFTLEKMMLNYASLLIKMELEGPFPVYIDFINDNDVLVKFEWKPLQCSHCQMFGHDIVIYKKKEVIRQECRAIHRDALPEGITEEQFHDLDQPTAAIQRDDFTLNNSNKELRLTGAEAQND